jgi:5-dehydro-2-deoxygluconokinase
VKSPLPVKPLDLICMGRAAVDLYGEQIGGRLEDQSTFAKYLGGSPANTGVCASRLGLKVAMLTRVGDEHNGRFVREALAAEGVDVSHVRTDPRRLTALVFLSIKDRTTFPLIFYRHDCADMAIAPEDFDDRFIASSKALLVSGTHFSQSGIAQTCLKAIETAKRQGVKVAFDIDYRPVLWGLTPPGLGEKRFVASQPVTARLQEVLPQCDLVIGTEEEFHIAGGVEDTAAAIGAIRRLTKATLVVKRGPLGCAVFSGGQDSEHKGFPIEVFNVLGAGDGFAGGFLSAWLRDQPLEECARRANAVGAIVVSRHGCAPAMPSRAELELFLSRTDWPFRLRDSSVLNEIHRKTTNRRLWPEVLALAFDHRRQLEELGPAEMIRKFKRLIASALTKHISPATGAIIDERYGDEALFALTGSGAWLARPVEVPGSVPLAFEAGDNIAAALRTWPAEHVVKCLFAFEEMNFSKVRQLQDACIATGHELLLEIIPKDLPRALKDCYAAGIRPDWWKLPPPRSGEEWLAVEGIIRGNDPYCRGVILLGMEASEAALERGFALAARHPICKGFAVGRSIFMDAARRWFAGACSDEDVVKTVSDKYAALAKSWRKARSECNESVS